MLANLSKTDPSLLEVAEERLELKLLLDGTVLALGMVDFEPFERLRPPPLLLLSVDGTADNVETLGGEELGSISMLLWKGRPESLRILRFSFRRLDA